MFVVGDVSEYIFKYDRNVCAQVYNIFVVWLIHHGSPKAELKYM